MGCAVAGWSNQEVPLGYLAEIESHAIRLERARVTPLLVAQKELSQPTRCFDRLFIVPEEQRDRSLARSAWKASPEGTVP